MAAVDAGSGYIARVTKWWAGDVATLIGHTRTERDIRAFLAKIDNEYRPLFQYERNKVTKAHVKLGVTMFRAYAMFFTDGTACLVKYATTKPVLRPHSPRRGKEVSKGYSVIRR
ncbi:MAG: hypothetical protein KKD28_06720 [Chloroflexi bacterium]|nr:hypothetical protein [Chloroflexota bacterium]